MPTPHRVPSVEGACPWFFAAREWPRPFGYQREPRCVLRPKRWTNSNPMERSDALPSLRPGPARREQPCERPRSPAFKEAGASSRSDHINGAVRALSSGFARGQLKVLTYDQRHGGCIMHRGHGGHPLPSVQFPTSSSHRGRCEAWVQSTAQRRRFQGREPHQTGDLAPAGQGIVQP